MIRNLRKLIFNEIVGYIVATMLGLGGAYLAQGKDKPVEAVKTEQTITSQEQKQPIIIVAEPGSTVTIHQTNNGS
ncbi:hypothetical protein [Pontibacter cellulosilyticus]|uniref:Uncharacterized protein n=1 Tax=Pontibacter cellulosilyticus TaxID=1720253 RepID=A0A923N938_9BACT|nr:hypothetical protein [Pontibacter cellulosilyticus]MBC5995098.1 hypothetical protein [Pontibacter cellulosilyticus]